MAAIRQSLSVKINSALRDEFVLLSFKSIIYETLLLNRNMYFNGG